MNEDLRVAIKVADFRVLTNHQTDRGRTRMKKHIAVVVAGLSLLLVMVGSASATPASFIGHKRLDAIASKYAERPITAVCERSNYDWDIRYELWGVAGVYFPDEPQYVFLSPDTCAPLLVALQTSGPIGLKDAGLQPLAFGLLVLLHESFHAAGYMNEAQAEACAMRSLPEGLADFGIARTKTVAVKRVKHQMHQGKVGKRLIRYRTSRVVTVYRTVANHDHARVLRWAAEWHALLPPEYQNGTC